MLITLVTDKRASMAGRKTNRIPYTDNRDYSTQYDEHCQKG